MKNKMWKLFLRIIKLGVLVIPLICLIYFAQENLFYFEDYNTRRIERFYEEEENSLDVVLMGASEVCAGFSPGYAYENYGFTSYMYAMDSNSGSMYLAQLKEIRKYHDPQVILVDIYGFLKGEGWGIYDEARFRLFVESIPFSLNKVQTILEHPFENKISYFVPLVKYHGELGTAQKRLAEIGKEEMVFPDLKGMVTMSSIYQGEGDPGENYGSDICQLGEDSRSFLVEFLNYCQREELDNIVFVNFPRLLKDESTNSMTQLVAGVEEVLDDHGYTLLNLQKEMNQIGIDTKRDYYNEHHLNIYGQMKLTDYFGSKLLNEYKVVPVPQTAENRQKWEKCVFDTRQYFEMTDTLILMGEEQYVNEKAYEWLSPAQIIGVG